MLKDYLNHLFGGQGNFIDFFILNLAFFSLIPPYSGIGTISNIILAFWVSIFNYYIYNEN